MPETKDSGLRLVIETLAKSIARLAENSELHTTAAPGLSLFQRDEPITGMYEASVCLDASVCSSEMAKQSKCLAFLILVMPGDGFGVWTLLPNICSRFDSVISTPISIFAQPDRLIQVLLSQILIFVTKRVLFCHEALFVTERTSCAKANR